MKKTGFTLAEVLITLGVIGVVAGMTIPVLMNYFQEQALLTQFNKGLKGDASGPDLYGTGGTIWYKLRLADGSSISTNGILRTLFVDINGDKGPNTIGKDLFFLYLNTKNGAPYVSWAINTIAPENCSKSLTDSWYDGGSCSYWVIRHGNMDYLHRDLSTTEWNN